MPKFMTIRQAAKTGILPEYRIRVMVASGDCPGILTGNRFMVNIDALSEKLKSESENFLQKK